MHESFIDIWGLKLKSSFEKVSALQFTKYYAKHIIQILIMFTPCEEGYALLKTVEPFKLSLARDTLQNGHLKGSEASDCEWLKAIGIHGVFSLEVSPFFFFTCRDLCLALSGVNGSCFSVDSFFVKMLL